MHLSLNNFKSSKFIKLSKIVFNFNNMTINNKAKNVVIGKGNSGQRLDNFLLSKIKNIPKSHVYKLIRTGQVRVNSSRSKPSAKVKLDDIVRIPPYKGLEELKPVISKEILNKTEDNVLFEDRNIIVFNKTD